MLLFLQMPGVTTTMVTLRTYQLLLQAIAAKSRTAPLAFASFNWCSRSLVVAMLPVPCAGELNEMHLNLLLADMDAFQARRACVSAWD